MQCAYNTHSARYNLVGFAAYVVLEMERPPPRGTKAFSNCEKYVGLDAGKQAFLIYSQGNVGDLWEEAALHQPLLRVAGLWGQVLRTEVRTRLRALFRLRYGATPRVR